MGKNGYLALNMPETLISSSSYNDDSVHANRQDASNQNVRRPEASQLEQKLISNEHRWYFSDNTTSMTKQESHGGGESTRNESTLTCSTDYRPPVKVSESTGPARWIFNSKSCVPGLCHVVFGISVKDLLLDSIGSIAFTVTEEGRLPPEFNEIISKSELKTMSELSTCVLAWELHQQLWTKEDYHEKSMAMEIQISEDSLSNVDSGFLEIHFMEFRAFQSGDTSLSVYQPYIWSINMDYGSDLKKREDTTKPKRIVHYAISGDGTHIVTLATTEKDLSLDLWDLRDPCESGAIASNKLKRKNSRGVQTGSPPSKTRSDWRPDILQASLSWDASQLALTIPKATFMAPLGAQRVFTVYNCDKVPRPTSGTATLPESNDYQECVGLRGYVGYGKFHITATKDHNIKNELFITCPAMDLLFTYTVFKWNHERTISFTQPQQEDILLSRRYASKQLIGCIRGNIFAWTGESDDVVSVWDIEHGSMVSIVHRQVQRHQRTRTDLSSDNKFMAIYRQGVITTHWISTGGLLGIFRLPEDHLEVFNLQYIRDDTQIMVDTGNTAEESGRGRVGLVLDAANMNIMRSFSIPEVHIVQHLSEGRQILYSANESRLHAIRLEDCIIESYSQPNPGCNDQCKDNLSSLRKQPTEYTAPSGLHFRVEICPTTATSSRNGPSSVILSMSIRDGVPRKKVVIPPFKNRHWIGTSAVFHDSRLVVATNSLVMIWKLPITMEDDLTMLWTRRMFLDFHNPQSRESEPLGVCTHGQLYANELYIDEKHNQVRGKSKLNCRRDERALCKEDSQSILMGMLVLIEVYKDADEMFRLSILKYVGSHINSYPSSDHSKGVLAYICSEWRAEDRINTEAFVAALLESPVGQWIPRSDMDLPSNPLHILLQKALKQPRAMDLAKVIIDYCIRRAKTDHEPQFLLPILQCLNTLIAQTQYYSDLALETVQGLVYVPVKSHPFVMFTYNPNGQDSQKDNFTRELFVASFDLLWFMTKSIEEVERHSFTAAMFENPAIEALVEYKWSTIGLKYWLVRFLFQVVFYLLVYSVVFLQVYDDIHGSGSIFYILIAIITMSCAFLWLELVQFMNNWRHYILSIYSWMDVCLYGLPFMASFNQILIISGKISGDTPRQGNSWLFSLSSGIVFFHCLTELRVFHSVCACVTMFIQMALKTRTLLILLVAGIPGPAVIFLHMLRSCPFTTCAESTSNFPTNLIQAMSVTFFFISGRYDPVSADLDSDNWPFLMTMTMYYFMTVVLLVNVLICKDMTPALD
ncbi:hypothetical protein BGZ58_010340 [Dissophora ornata]|nr:hypothetical protein BGZ58_010340 [Dissophora ornata]